MSKWIKNSSGGTKTWVGQQVADATYYEIQSIEENQWANDSTLLIDIASSGALVAKDDSGNKDITDINEAINYLKGALSPEVVIREETTKTGGHFQETSYLIDVGSGDSTKTVDISFPFPMSLLAASWQNKDEFEGDSIEFTVGPDTTTGAITADVVVDDDEITVAQTVIDNTAIGYYILLDDGTNTEDLGRVVAVDRVNLKITTENASTTAFVASTPTYVKQTIKMLPKSVLDCCGPMSAGESKIGGSYIPANTTLRAIYYNDVSTAKKFIFFLEYLY